MHLNPTRAYRLTRSWSERYLTTEASVAKYRCCAAIGLSLSCWPFGLSTRLTLTDSVTFQIPTLLLSVYPWGGGYYLNHLSVGSALFSSSPSLLPSSTIPGSLSCRIPSSLSTMNKHTPPFHLCPLLPSNGGFYRLLCLYQYKMDARNTGRDVIRRQARNKRPL